jgi:uncharacterized membrane-anchored protein
MDALYDEIRQLLDGGDDLERIEHTLTTGYAHALDLEAERWRIERRLSEIAAGISSGDTSAKTREMSALVERLEGAAASLRELRAALGDLRRHADGVRLASA